MALLKNLYLDFTFLNPFKKRKAKEIKSQPDIEQRYQSSKEAIEIKELPQVSKQIIISENKKLELPKISRKQVEQPPKIDVLKSSSQKPVLAVQKNQTYFSNVSSTELIHKDLFKEMQTFWQEQKNQTVNMHLNQQMNDEMSKKIDELQQMEIEWQRMQLDNEKMKDELSSKELHIENHIKDLKKRFKGMHFHAHTPDNHSFILSNGTKLKSLNDLSSALLKMDDYVFYSHVNEQKNDFSSWVKDVMNLNDLSDKLSSVKDRQGMLSALQDWKNSH